MIMYYGLNKKVGNVSFYDSTGSSEYTFTKPYSEKTSQLIDEEVSLMIENAYIKTKELIKTHQAQLIEVAQQLLDNEVIFKEDLENIIGKRPFTKEEYQPMSQHKKIFANGDPNAVPTPSTNGQSNGADKSTPPGMIILDDESAISEEELKQEEAERDLMVAKRKAEEAAQKPVEVAAQPPATDEKTADAPPQNGESKKAAQQEKDKKTPDKPTTPTLF